MKARDAIGSLPMLRALRIRWRILSLAAFNVLMAAIFAVVIWDGAQTLRSARNELRWTRDSDRLLALLESQTGHLQSLIHRYFTQPNADLLNEIMDVRTALLGTLNDRAAVDPILAGSAAELVRTTERFVAGFGDLRAVQATIATTYEHQVLVPAREMSGLYAIVEGATRDRTALIWPALSKSRESFSTTLVLTNVFYLTQARDVAEEVTRNLESVEGIIPVMMDLADNDLQRGALGALGYRAVSWRLGIAQLAESFATRARLLSEAIDGNRLATTRAIEQLSSSMREREARAYQRFEKTLSDVYVKIAVIAILSLSIAILIGLAIAASIVHPLRTLMDAMHAIVTGNYGRPTKDVNARDEIGEMARAVEIFRENAIAKRQAELELQASKDRAERALRELQETQQSLIEAEKLAALGGLVAGVAHEVNNPIGISLTVASSFARRAEIFESELRTEPLRRSKLDEFVRTSRDAAGQLVANLHRAGELIQSFKQVAVDRSHAERRQFSLSEATDQIVASLKPVLKKAAITLSVDVPEGLVIDGYPGSYGQILTNLFLNAANHAFADGRSGAITISARARGSDDIEIIFADNGAGMTPDVQRQAFDPFFTTRRNEGGTGLGLHIVYNLVTQQLGGRMMLESRLGQGTTFRIIMPRVARGTPTIPDTAADGTLQWPNRTM